MADGLRKQLARTIRVNARPLTESEWRAVLTNAGFEVEWVGFAPMALLSPRRNLADEGLLRVARIIRNLIRCVVSGDVSVFLGGWGFKIFQDLCPLVIGKNSFDVPGHLSENL